jgi:prophage regulatory protein
MPQRVYGFPELAQFTGGKKKACVYAWIKLGRFPKPIRTGPNSVGWLESDLEQWQRERIAASERVEATT